MGVRTTTTGVELDVCGECGAVWFDRGEVLLYVRDRTAVARAIGVARDAEADAGVLVDGSFGDDAPFILDRDSGGLFVPGPTLAHLQESGALRIAWQPPPRTEPLKFAVPRLGLRTVATVVGLFGVTFALLLLAFDDVPWPATLASTATALALAFLVSPLVMDVQLQVFYSARRTPLDQLPNHLRAFIERVCAEHRMQPPRLFMIEDGTPTAMTYGQTPSTARVVISTGLLRVLEPKELEAVVGHELGHARYWDIAVMTAVEVPAQLLYFVYQTLREEGDGKDKGFKASLATIAYVGYLTAEVVALWLSRTREYHADRFGALATQSPNALASALIKIAYGLAARPSPKTRRRSAADVRSLGIFDAQAAPTLAISTRHGSERLAPNEFRLSDVQGAMKWDLWNPWATVFELGSTHPLIAKRLLHLATISVELGEAPLVAFDLRRPESYWDEFAVDLAVQFAPWAVLVSIPSVFFPLGDLQGAGVGVLLLALALAVRLLVRYRAPVFAEMSVATLMRQVKVSDIRGVPCRLQGSVRGRGEPGLIWSEDFVLHDATGMIFLDHRQPFALWEALWGWLSSWKVHGADMTVEGWFRRAPVPYVEIARYWVGDTLRRSWYRHFRWLGVVVVAVGGAVMVAWPSVFG
jgi:Zn-dependent protease with chaperone function